MTLIQICCAWLVGMAASDQLRLPSLPSLVLALAASVLAAVWWSTRALLANRGLVKRALAEVQSEALEVALDEDPSGTLTLRWSDGVTCTLPSDAPLAGGRCTCPSTTLCRHLLRSVLAYQRLAPANVDDLTTSASSIWDPGAIGDDELKTYIPRPKLAAARRLFDAGQVIELARSHRPAARFHSLGGMLRFLVAGDVRYTHCECAEPDPCSHVPLAIWAFRLLDPDAPGGFVTTSTVPLSVPSELFDEVETALREVVGSGLATVARPLLDRLRRLETACRQEGLIWPGDILADLVQQAEAYATHDARFAPERVVELLGEWCMRSDAIKADTGAVPQLFLRGTPSDRTTDVGFTRLIGLGCDVRVRRGSVELTALLQDSSSGVLVSLSRAFADPPGAAPDERRSFRQLAQTLPIKGSSFAALGAGQVVAKGGKRTPAGAFTPGRAPFSLSPQAYAWETLRAPVLVDDFTELRSRNAAAPAGLRPRRVGEDLVVCPVASVEGVTFNAAQQVLEAVLRDQNGDRAMLAHPYTARGHDGFETLFRLLRTRPRELRFVCAHARRGPRGLLLAPISLLFESASSRIMCQPWIDAQEHTGKEARFFGDAPPAAVSPDPVAHFQQQLATALSELCLLGLQGVDEQASRAWSEIVRCGSAAGFTRAIDPAEWLSAALASRQRSLEWVEQAAAAGVLQLAVLSNVMSEVLASGGGLQQA